MTLVTIVIVLNRQWIYDYVRGLSYEPSNEMSRIREDLRLTEQGEFLFNAAQPVLSESEEFNEKCRLILDMEVAVLGCYTGGNIYVYDITDKSLDGIRELTAAHELLHAVFARMSETEKEGLKSDLEQVRKENADVLDEDLNTYSSDEQFEELYVRAGTEVADLPSALEEHYAEIFTDQDLIVSFYNGYIAVFKENKAKIEALGGELSNLNAIIEEKKSVYEQESAGLNSEIIEFNSCVESGDCFDSLEAFRARRNQLMLRQENLNGLYIEINNLVDTYNNKVAEYNSYVLEGKKLNSLINSVDVLEEVQ